tara:strand:- start:2276 stop:3982 length:1707 start_codon:yes stop_codon:yes gene_type:complete
MHYNLFKSRNRAYLEEMANRVQDMPEIYQAVNSMQGTPFKINKKVYQVAITIYNNGSVVGKLPSTEDSPLPPKPIDIATNPETRTQWKRLASVIHSVNSTLNSKRLLISKIFGVAETYENEPEIYFPMQYDFRSRIYCMPMFLNYQGNDLSKSLLLFSKGKKIEDNSSLQRLAIHGANTYGEDKITLDKRVKWVEKNEKFILASAKEPHDNYEFWSRCSEPFQFLAFCFEWEEFKKSGEMSGDFITHLPCYSDCTNSGLQIFSGMLKDEVGGKATNLTAEETPQDVYLEVANKTLELLNEADDSILKSMWLEYGLSRKTTKKVTMCIVYGLTRYSCRAYIEDHLKDMEEEGKECPFLKIKDKSGIPTIFQATNYLSKLVWEAIGEVIVSAKEAMLWLQQVSRLVSDNQLPVTWTTPTNFIVQMNYMEMKKQRVNTKMGESMVTKKITIQHETNKIDKRKVANAISPCFIHSLDASILQKAVCYASNNGITNFACIHDSFGVLATDVELMNQCIRQSFVDIFADEDVLGNFCKEITEQVAKEKRHLIPPLPKIRKLDIKQVLKSDYFCS